MQKYEQLCAYVQSSEKNTGGDGYANVDVRPSHINFAMYVKQTEKATASKMRKLGRDRQLTISHECLEHDCKLAR